MTWFKVDDALPAHRKVLSIPRGGRRLAAIGAWTLVGAWVAGNTTDGRFPNSLLDELAIPARAVQDLLDAGLWEQNGHGYIVHDYLDYNPSAEKVKTDRAAGAERQRKAREAAKAARDTEQTKKGAA